MSSTFTPLKMPDFVSDRERMLISQLVPLAEAWCREHGGHLLVWRVHEYTDPEGYDTTILELKLTDWEYPDCAGYFDIWWTYYERFYADVVTKWADHYRDTPIFDDILCMQVDLGYEVEGPLG